MIKRMLVPLDGSAPAEAAIPVATRLAQRCQAELVLVRVVPEATLAAGKAPQPPAASPEQHSSLDAIAARLRTEGVPVRVLVAPASSAAGIASQATLGQVDLLVMTTQGRTGLEALLHPSVTWQVLTETTAPILTWKPAEDAVAQRALPRFLTDPTAPLLVPLDGSRGAERALPLAEEIARLFGNPLVLVRAVEPPLSGGMETPPQTGEEALRASLAAAEQYLRPLHEALSRAGFQVKVAGGQGLAAELIEAAVLEWQAGLVIMATHGRGALGQFLVGKVTRRVLANVEVPFLLIRRLLLPRDTLLGAETT